MTNCLAILWRQVLNAFNDLTGNSDRNPWCIGAARIDLERMRLFAPSRRPIIVAQHLAGDDVAFVADPFRIESNGQTFIFTEVWSRSEQRGKIAVFQINRGGVVEHSAIVLAESFHLSYPCVFKEAETYYMLPEAWETGQLVLYRALEFPWSWERFRVLFELDYADPQIFLHQDVWYIFLNTDPLTNANRSVFWGESLLGEWRPHPQNSVVESDPRLARSAGSIIRHRGRIIRFSQDCSHRYGRSVFASEIIELSPLIIRSTSIGQVEFNRLEWAMDGFHHLDVFLENGVYYALFDGYTSSFIQRRNRSVQN